MVKVAEGIVFDNRINLSAIVSALTVIAVVLWWGSGLENDVENNTGAITIIDQTVMEGLANIRLDYVSADLVVKDRHQTEFIRINQEVDNLSDDQTALAIAVGVTGANIEAMQRTLTSIDSKLEARP